jgi:hypothetical protein
LHRLRRSPECVSIVVADGCSARAISTWRLRPKPRPENMQGGSDSEKHATKSRRGRRVVTKYGEYADDRRSRILRHSRFRRLYMSFLASSSTIALVVFTLVVPQKPGRRDGRRLPKHFAPRHGSPTRPACPAPRMSTSTSTSTRPTRIGTRSSLPSRAMGTRRSWTRCERPLRWGR